MRVSSGLLSFLLAACLAIVESRHHRKHHHKTTTKPSTKSWEYLMFVMEWPQTQCEFLNVTHRHPCKIPAEAKGWTIHGLWPSTSKSPHQPFFCTKDKFNPDKVADIKEELEQYWPNLYADSSVDSLWKHEYEKHGTCAAQLPTFADEHDYFKNTLVIREKYDYGVVLADSEIVPSLSEGYHIDDIQAALDKKFGVRSCPGCQYQKKLGQMISQIYVCMDKSLKLIDCHTCEHPCRANEPVLYHPAFSHRSMRAVGAAYQPDSQMDHSAKRIGPLVGLIMAGCVLAVLVVVVVRRPHSRRTSYQVMEDPPFQE